MVILAGLCVASLLACIALTHTKPVWAFYLLPTRAWELLAGSILANWSEDRSPNQRKIWPRMSLFGLALILVSLFVIKQGTSFPGYIALLPVVGTVCVIGPNNGSSGIAEKLLSSKPMVMIGRMSYSLYLWHWPVFSLVD
jgi:peptidoglycan/LPS O-acetylase OafA/YrhL